MYNLPPASISRHELTITFYIPAYHIHKAGYRPGHFFRAAIAERLDISCLDRIHSYRARKIRPQQSGKRQHVRQVDLMRRCKCYGLMIDGLNKAKSSSGWVGAGDNRVDNNAPLGVNNVVKKRKPTHRQFLEGNIN